MTGGVWSRTMTRLVENDLLFDASPTVITTTFVPSASGALFVGLCVMVSAPDKSVARIKFVPVTFVISATQLEFAAITRLVKLNVIVGGVVSRTMTVRVAVLVLPLPSVAR